MNPTVRPIAFQGIESIRNGSEQGGIRPSERLSIVEQMFESVCKSKRLKDDLATALGWSTSMVDKVASGSTGVRIDKIAALLTALNLVTFTAEYADYLARGNVIGSNCYCARQNMGECGRQG